MFQSPARVANDIDEHIPLIGNFSPQINVSGNYFLKVFGGFLSVPNTSFVHIDQSVFNSIDSKRIEIDVARHDRVVDQFIVVASDVLMGLFPVFESGCGPSPIFGQFQLYCVFTVHLFGDRKKRRSAVEHSVGLTYPVGSHTLFVAIESVSNPECFCLRGVDRPAILFCLFNCQWTASTRSGRRLDLVDVFGVFTNQIRTWRPDRHHDFGFVSGCLTDHGNRNVMIQSVGKVYRVRRPRFLNILRVLSKRQGWKKETKRERDIS